MRTPIIAGNWKMNKTIAEGTAFIKTLGANLTPEQTQALNVVLFPSFVGLETLQQTVQKQASSIAIGAQTMESHDKGAYTGEVSPVMLSELKIQWVIVGHSERRQNYNETDTTVAEKTNAALANGMIPIVCVGESLEQREAGQTDAVVTNQVNAVWQTLDPSRQEKVVFAYEPIWAIGTGKTCEAPEANRVCGLIRSQLGSTGDQVRVLYGGSVKPGNIEALMSEPDIDGGLIGGASLDPDDFFQMIQATVKLSQSLVNA